MPRMVPAALVAVLVLITTSALAAETESEPSPGDEVAYERIEAPEAGLAMAFPAGWRVSLPQGTRESQIRTPEGDPVFATTAVLANGGEGRWCDVDVFLDMPAMLDEHAHAYAAYLQRVSGSDAPMVIVETELPAGPAFRIEVFDRAQARLRVMYLFDGPVDEDGTLERYLLTCAAPSDSEPFWQTIAESAEVFAATPLTAEEPGEATPEA